MLIGLKNMKKKELHIFTDKQMNRKVLFILMFFLFQAYLQHCPGTKWPKWPLYSYENSAFESQHYTQKRK